jgi:hypothetical protein
MLKTCKVRRRCGTFFCTIACAVVLAWSAVIALTSTPTTTTATTTAFTAWRF